ncbi:MAG: hypothetical protein KIT57_11895 [Blastocatellales bacterium]|nr:hypothetical protein [Blastocatellales bacterium]
MMPAIVGWSRYYSTVVSKRTFNYLDMVLFSILPGLGVPSPYGENARTDHPQILEPNYRKALDLPDSWGKATIARHSQTPIRDTSR